MRLRIIAQAGQRPKAGRPCCQYGSVRFNHTDSRQRLSSFWIPHVRVEVKEGAVTDATTLLMQAGYVRQTYAGIFHMLPLGLRVQEKLERLIDKYMRSLGASKVSLSSVSSQALWAKSGRLQSDSEFFKFKDRRKISLLLAPTHEEEITTLMAPAVTSPKSLPVRLYQIGRKYRDELRPRGGLLRGREFLMKDLYTFDATEQDAHRTYDEIRQGYRNFLDELTVKYVEVRADSGNMGGNLSHEYHFPNHAGEDQILTCSECDLARNEEYVDQTPILSVQNLQDVPVAGSIQDKPIPSFRKDYVSKDGLTLVRTFAPRKQSEPGSETAPRQEINSYILKAILNRMVELDTGVENPLKRFNQARTSTQLEKIPQKPTVYYILDSQVSFDDISEQVQADVKEFSADMQYFVVQTAEGSPNPIRLRKLQQGDPCPQCDSGKIDIQHAIEIGHTFHLGTRYSSKLGLNVSIEGHEGQHNQVKTPVEMGCHGIGVSRLIAAVASCLSDNYGLNWPRVIAPFEVAILSHRTEEAKLAEELYDNLSCVPGNPVDSIIDDRLNTLPFKMKDADMIGYPILLILGKGLKDNKVEVQCRRLKFREQIETNFVVPVVQGLLQRL
ncbi:proline-tRNA ligase [Exophiala mesophila]|uniref:proline--tRNA ligase n=1 Tax=Exophiala mesophila TaxID=212818 RepID=A0A0D1WW82_EXOME|nr:proline-tRNA ligase [Exophiala mesophila]KIV93625.1 proline-tRNA ligase [Exophiala mesophila]